MVLKDACCCHSGCFCGRGNIRKKYLLGKNQITLNVTKNVQTEQKCSFKILDKHEIHKGLFGQI